MLELKDEWDLKVLDLYNTDVKVQYMCYLDHVKDTIGALMGHKHGINLDFDLHEGKNASGKSQITVTTIHQSKYSATKNGDGYGYGKDLKQTMEDKILESVISKASAEYRNMTNVERQVETLAAFVPDVQKKPAKPVNAQTALTLSCRRK